MRHSNDKQRGRRGSKRRDERNVWKGLAAGVVGGLVASYAMNQFQALWSKLAVGEERQHGAQTLQKGPPGHGVARELQQRNDDEEDADATERAAEAISQGLFGHRLTKSEKETGGVVAHYAMGVTSGALYGATAELVPETTAGFGLPFGAAVWAVADEGVVPALGLSKPPTEYPLSTHAYALASHLVYGLAAEVVRRAVRRVY